MTRLPAPPKGAVQLTPLQATAAYTARESDTATARLTPSELTATLECIQSGHHYTALMACGELVHVHTARRKHPCKVYEDTYGPMGKRVEGIPLPKEEALSLIRASKDLKNQFHYFENGALLMNSISTGRREIVRRPDGELDHRLIK